MFILSRTTLNFQKLGQIWPQICQSEPSAILSWLCLALHGPFYGSSISSAKNNTLHLPWGLYTCHFHWKPLPLQPFFGQVNCNSVFRSQLRHHLGKLSMTYRLGLSTIHSWGTLPFLFTMLNKGCSCICIFVTIPLIVLYLTRPKLQDTGTLFFLYTSVSSA